MIRLECIENVLNACEVMTMTDISDVTHYFVDDIRLAVLENDTFPLYCIIEISKACKEVVDNHTRLNKKCRNPASSS